MENVYEQIFLEEKCDKHYHRYHEYYDLIVGKTDISSVLDIGVCWGDSLRAWRRIWPNAEIEGIDLFRQYDLKLEEQFKIYNIDSTKRHLADEIEKQYDIIIDDGDHHWKAQLATFENYYHKAKKFYVIEDVIGDYGLERLKHFIPSHALDKAMVFDSKARQRRFEFNGKTIITNYKFMIFDKS
jgi:hypothetical protein